MKDSAAAAATMTAAADRSRERGTSPRLRASSRRFGVARSVAKEMSNRRELADLSRLHAQMLLDRGSTGDYERAAEMLEGALAAYREFGMPGYVADVERLRLQALA